MKLKLILVSRDEERLDWEESEHEPVRTLKKKLQTELFDASTDHLRLLCGGRELEDGKLLRDALHGVREPVALHVVAVKSTKATKPAKATKTEEKLSLCSQLCIIQ